MTDPPPPEFGNLGQPGPTPPPAFGYLVPAPAPHWLGADPLVTAPAEGFSGWFNRLFSVLRRSWKSILLISWTTYAVPAVALVAVLGLATNSLIELPPAGSSQSPSFDTSLLGVFIVAGIAGFIVVGYLTSAAQAAVVWTVTRQAAGQPAPLGAALKYGLRNGIRLWGWSLLYALIIGAGTCACILPGLYLALAGCLYIPVALYRRGLGPISTSFSLVNKNFGAALGRMALLLLMVYGVQLVFSVPIRLATAGSTTLGVVLSAAVALVTAPLALVLTTGSVLLFAELWARRAPTTTADLDAALG